MRCIAALLLTFVGLLGCSDDLFEDFPQELREATTTTDAVTLRYQEFAQKGFTIHRVSSY